MDRRCRGRATPVRRGAPAARSRAVPEPVPRNSPQFERAPAFARIPPGRAPAPVLAKAWRKNTPAIVHLVQACVIEPLDSACAKEIGLLLAGSGTSDIIDAMVVLGAVARRDTIVTTDPEDMERLLTAAGAKLPLILV
jgi:hypothetical protein